MNIKFKTFLNNKDYLVLLKYYYIIIIYKIIM